MFDLQDNDKQWLFNVPIGNSNVSWQKDCTFHRLRQLFLFDLAPFGKQLFQTESTYDKTQIKSKIKNKNENNNETVASKTMTVVNQTHLNQLQMADKDVLACSAQLQSKLMADYDNILSAKIQSLGLRDYKSVQLKVKHKPRNFNFEHANNEEFVYCTP